MVCSFKRLIYPKSMEAADASGYMVALYEPLEKVLDAEGYPITEVKVVGHFLPTNGGIRVEMNGHWSKSKFGPQFEVESFKETVPPTREGIVAYLSSGLIKGIGPKTAAKIFDAFGEETLEILDKQPDRLMTIRGISENKLKRIMESYLISRGARDILAFLGPHGVSPSRCVKIHNAYGPKAVTMVREHPYLLMDIAGIGFVIADSIARNTGLDPFSAERISAGLIHTLVVAEGHGHLCLEKGKYIKQCLKLLATEGLAAAQVATQAYELLLRGKLSLYKNHVYRYVTAESEQQIATRVQELLILGEISYKKNLDEMIDAEQGKLGLALAPKQRLAVKSCLSSHISIITGGPGTGKTLIQRVLLNIYRQENPDAVVVCCAPTGRAARRMQQCTDFPASTVHKALGLLTGEDGFFNEPDILEADLVLVDETSMMDVHLARYLLNALPADCQLILVGDADQLASVGPGAILSELIASEAIPVVKLERVYRQHAGSRIAINASLIKHNNLSLEYGEDFKLIESAEFEQSADIIEEIYLAETARLGVDNVALLTPFKKKTQTGASILNERLREKVNPPMTGRPETTFGKKLFRLGDKVMQIRNKGDINNGDVGYITDIQNQYGEIMVSVDYGDDRVAEYSPVDLDLLELAYASTVHKSQGSEYPTVLINLQSSHGIMLKRPLVYTAITRAKQKVVIIGERKALCSAIRRMDTERRGTMLAERINEHAPVRA